MGKTVLEIAGRTDLTRELATEYWYNGTKTVAYRGQDIIEEFYPTVDELLSEYLDDEDIDRQESYLAYDPYADKFVMGFDAWAHDEGGMFYEMVLFRYDAERRQLSDVYTLDGPDGVYPAGREEVPRRFPELRLIELRLD